MQQQQQQQQQEQQQQQQQQQQEEEEDCTQRDHTSTNANHTWPRELWLPQPKVIWDLNPEFRIDPDIGVHHIAPKM